MVSFLVINQFWACSYFSCCMEFIWLNYVNDGFNWKTHFFAVRSLGPFPKVSKEDPIDIGKDDCEI